jgi:hypothetical protein
MSRRSCSRIRNTTNSAGSAGTTPASHITNPFSMSVCVIVARSHFAKKASFRLVPCKRPEAYKKVRCPLMSFPHLFPQAGPVGEFISYPSKPSQTPGFREFTGKSGIHAVGRRDFLDGDGVGHRGLPIWSQGKRGGTNMPGDLMRWRCIST